MRLQGDKLSQYPNSCTRSDETGHHLHVLIDDARAMHYRGEEKHERTLFLEVVATAITSSVPPNVLETISARETADGNIITSLHSSQV
jgi:hypothetical protein